VGIPQTLDIKILTPSDQQMAYRYEISALEIFEDDLNISELPTGARLQFSWNDRCQYIDGEKELLWTTKSGAKTFSIWGQIFSGRTIFLPRSHSPENPQTKFPDEIDWIYDVVKGVRLLLGNLVRQSRHHATTLVVGEHISYGSYDLADYLSVKVIRLMQKGETNELESVCQRVGIANTITVEQFFSGANKDSYYASVLLDGVNIGLLSDGTLRVLSILIEIITSRSGATIIIEEPEMQIHPGMLAKLLNEIETYTYDKNLILSTHSPQVVAWTSPDKINLVHRHDGKTIVRKLEADEIQRVSNYLNEEGDLGEWIYSGMLDE